MAQSQGNQGLFDVAVAELQVHPRCVNARLVLFQIDWINNDMKAAGDQIHALENQAPYRLDFLKMASAYAARVHDTVLQHQLFIQMEKVGIITFVHSNKPATSSTATTNSTVAK
jgi:hypothetical protein